MKQLRTGFNSLKEQRSRENACDKKRLFKKVFLFNFSFGLHRLLGRGTFDK